METHALIEELEVETGTRLLIIDDDEKLCVFYVYGVY
jgi:hypothetical protein